MPFGPAGRREKSWYDWGRVAIEDFGSYWLFAVCDEVHD